VRTDTYGHTYINTLTRAANGKCEPAVAEQFRETHSRRAAELDIDDGI